MHEVKSTQDLLNQISRDEILLPEFQRGYVWNRDQVRGLMQSLYRKHPTGHLLIWRTYKPSLVRGGETARDGHSLLLLDGQQRLTTLWVLFKGKAPRFYEGESLFFDLHFNMQTQEFRFWQKSQMENNPAWIGVRPAPRGAGRHGPPAPEPAHHARERTGPSAARASSRARARRPPSPSTPATAR